MIGLILLHLLLVVLAASAVVGLIWSFRRPVSVAEPFGWLLIGFGGLGLASLMTRGPRDGWIVAGFVFLVLVVTLIGFIASNLRLVHRWINRHQVASTEYHGSVRNIPWIIAGSSLLALGIVIVMLMPATPFVRETTRRVDCMSRMRQIVLGMDQWHILKGQYPDAAPLSESGVLYSWRISMSIFLEMGELYKSYDLSKPWNAAENLKVAQAHIAADSWICPSVADPNILRDEQQRYRTGSVLPIGNETIFPQGRALAMHEIGDGLSTTIMLLENWDARPVWTEPRDVDVDALPHHARRVFSKSSPEPGILASFHGAGANVLFADGSAKTISFSTDPEVLRRLLTANGNDNLVDID